MALQETETFIPDNLFAGTQVQPVVADEVVIATGAGVVVRGTVLGLITASGKYAPVDSSKSDGSQSPVAVLSETVDATSADAVSAGYFTGEFNSRALVFGGTDTAATHTAAARARGLFFKDTVPA